MRRGWRTCGPLQAWIVAGLLTVLVGCSANAGEIAQGRRTPHPTQVPTALPRLDPSPSPTPARTLPPTLADPSASPAATDPPAQPQPTPKERPRYDPPPTAGPFEMNLYRRGDFASQATKIYCVPGAMQTMMNVMDRGATKASRTAQDPLYRLARRLSTDRLRGQGAEAEGWARGLERLGYGKFEVVVAGSRKGAIRAAARALRETNRPVGLLVWRGAHAWVMTGFKATADPAFGSEYEVTHVRIVDVWYPRVSSIWGASVRPNTLVPVGKLQEDYLPFRRPLIRHPDKDGRFVLVAPVDEGGAAGSMG
jgi:hypothetical protein